MIGVTLALAFVTFVFLFWRRKRRNIPPGPPSIPILGSFPFISVKRGLFEWALDESVTKHNISTVWLGPKQIFVINDFDLAKELFGKDEFSGRGPSQFHLAHRFFHGKPQGIINTEGIQWATQRRFSLKTLKDFGFGKQSLEETINLEVDQIVLQFLSTDGDNLLSTDFNIPMINILWQLVAGYRFTPDDPEGMEVVSTVNDMFKIGIKAALIPLPILKMFPKLGNYKERVNIYDVQKSYIMKQIEEHDQTCDQGSPRDFIDVYLNEIAKDDRDEDFNKQDLGICMMDFLQAGTETSSTTLKWIVLYLTLHQEVQNKCRNEILETLGNCLCKVVDMTRLPYVQGTIAEVQRLSRVAPFSLSHKTTVKTKVEDFSFPAGSVFFANLSFIMNDPKYFDQPEIFNPGRHIGPDGKYVKNERIIPFGIGKRYCMGELLARNEVFLFTVNLIQKLKFFPHEDKPLPDPRNYNSSFTNIPDDFFVRFVQNM